MARWAKIYCSKVCQGKDQRGDKSPNWFGDSVGYYGIHDWLGQYYGKAIECEKCGSKYRVQWSKLHGKKYERKRENFWQLCCLCHIEYDKTSLTFRPVWNKGRSWTEEEKRKISGGLKEVWLG
jgi:hypothetical protein